MARERIKVKIPKIKLVASTRANISIKGSELTTQRNRFQQKVKSS